MSTRNNGHPNYDKIPWLWIVIAFSVVPPLGLVLLFLKLREMSNNPSFRQKEWQRKSREWFEAVERGVAQNIQHGADGQKTDEGARAKREKKSGTGAKKDNDFAGWKPIRGGEVAVFAGIFFAAIFGIATVDELIQLHGNPWAAIQEAFPALMFTCLGLALAAWGHFKSKQAKRFRKLRNLIGRQKVVDIHAIAEAFPCSYEKACEMLQDMAYEGHLGKTAYVNAAAGQLVLTGEGVQARKRAEKEAAVKRAEEELSILREIRQVNDAIPDPELSRKIDRIEEITGHILEYQKKHPEKTGELHTFLNYYLPTTLKILNSYAELERQGVEGENISATKERIEEMMDMVVEGFETQLDKLFRDEMLDIASDIAVMERMMDRDGLTDHDMVMPKAPDKEESAGERASLTLDPEEKREPAAQGASAARGSWEQGFYRRTREELNQTAENGDA